MSGDDPPAATAAKLVAKKVLYCGVCGLPPEYCEFGPDFEKCKPWLLEHSPHTYPDLAAGKLEGLQVSTGAGGSAAQPSGDTAAAVAGGAAQAQDGARDGAGAGAQQQKQEVVKLPGGKVKKKEKAEVVVEKVTRSKRKSVTTIKGLDLFGVKLGDAAKKMGKKFACGASVVKGPTEKEQIDVQGDIIFDVADYITETWPDVPRESIFMMEDGKKVPAM